MTRSTINEFFIRDHPFFGVICVHHFYFSFRCISFSLVR